MPEVALVAPKDYGRVADFLATFPGNRHSRELWLARLQAWWEQNPAFHEGFERGWMLVEAGQVVGFLGAIPLRFQAGEKDILSVGGTTWRVAQEFRGMSFALKQRKMKAHPATLHTTTTPAPQVVAMLKLLRYEPMAIMQGGKQHGMVVLRFLPLMLARFPRAPLRWLAPLMALGARIIQALKLRHLPKANAAEVETAEAIGPEFDALWERTRHRFSHTNVRSAAVLRWYCFGAMPGEKRLFAVRDGGAVRGYLILLVESEPGITVARCVDVWWDVGDAQPMLGALVAAAIQWGKRRGVDRVLFPHFHAELARHYRALGVPERPAWERREYFWASAAIRTGMEPNCCYFTGMQGDLGM